MTIFETLSIVGLITGPVAAVLITLAVEKRRSRRSQQLQVLRMLLSTRHLVSDPLYSAAINLIPAEFDGDEAVMVSWRNYIEAVRYRPAEENRAEHDQVVEAKQTSLIYEIMKAMGFKLSEGDIRTSAYAADGFIKRQEVEVGSWLAMIDIAASLRRQTELLAPAPAAGTNPEPDPSLLPSDAGG